MPPKEKVLKEVTAVQVFSLDNMNPSLLPELATFKKIQLKVVKENPFVAITDATSRDLAKKYRTARVSARTSLQGQDKLISAKFNEAKTKAKTYIAELIALTQVGELEQQKEIDRDESVLEAKRQEKARLEQLRIDNIKKELDDYAAMWRITFNLMSFSSIVEVGANFLQSYTDYDLTVLEEFQALFPSKVQELTELLADKTSSLTNAENARLEKEKIDLELKRTRVLVAAGFSFDGNNYYVSDFIRLDMQTILSQSDSSFEEIIKGGVAELARLSAIEDAEQKAIADKLAQEKAEFAAKQKLADEAEANAKAERAAFEKEKAAFAAKQAEAANKYQVIAGSLNATHESILPTAPEAIKVIEPEILVPDLTTANVCTSLQPETLPDTIAYDLPKSTWKSIEEDFKNSSYKSYSKFLVDNYKVPTKL
jgi:hypothetical protein